jgi:hypothetical protein
MTQSLNPKDRVQFEELLVATSIQIDAMYQLLIQKGLFTEAEFLDKLKEVQIDYQSRQPVILSERVSGKVLSLN